jgi:hypothetical protein
VQGHPIWTSSRRLGRTDAASAWDQEETDAILQLEELFTIIKLITEDFFLIALLLGFFKIVFSSKINCYNRIFEVLILFFIFSTR